MKDKLQKELERYENYSIGVLAAGTLACLFIVLSSKLEMSLGTLAIGTMIIQFIIGFLCGKKSEISSNINKMKKEIH